MEHLKAHFWLTDDGSVLCKPCGATYRASDAEIARFSLLGGKIFMQQHRACGGIDQILRQDQQQPSPVKVQIPYKVIPNKPARAASTPAAYEVKIGIDHMDLADHYARASKGDKTRALLMALDAGYDFTRVVGAFGDEGVKISFQCLLKGWIDQGHITDAGRAELQKGAEA